MHDAFQDFSERYFDQPMKRDDEGVNLLDVWSRILLDEL